MKHVTWQVFLQKISYFSQNFKCLLLFSFRVKFCYPMQNFIFFPKCFLIYVLNYIEQLRCEVHFNIKFTYFLRHFFILVEFTYFRQNSYLLQDFIVLGKFIYYFTHKFVILPLEFHYSFMKNDIKISARKFPDHYSNIQVAKIAIVKQLCPPPPPSYNTSM